MGRTIKELEEAQNAIAVELMGEEPCTTARLSSAGGDAYARKSCVQREEERPLTRAERARGWARRPFGGYDAASMCSACAAYWHASMARISLLDVIRFRAVVETEQKKEAARG